MNHEEHALKAARVFLENMVAEGLLARQAGLDVTPRTVVDASFAQVLDSLRNALPLAQLMDASDMLFHAEGPGASHDAPALSSVTWLLTTVESNIRKLSSALLDLWGADGHALARKLDVRMPGLVPGSVWVGVKLQPPDADLLESDAKLVAQIGRNLAELPALSRFIDDEGMRPGVEEFLPDPALRDAHLAALLSFAPTGRRKIHTIEISAKSSGSASLGQRERVVLKEVLRRPDSRKARDGGSFVGEVREADLDKTRIHLRNVPQVGTLRCVMPELPAKKAASLLGRTVRAEGRYLADRDGRPRLLFVERITPVEQLALLDDQPD